MIPKIQNQKSTNKSNRFCHTSRKIVEAWKIKNVLLNGYDPIVQTLLAKVERYNDSVKSQLIGSFTSSFTFFLFCSVFSSFFWFFFQITLQRLDHGQAQPQILRELWVWNNAVIWQFVMPMPDTEIMESSLYL